MVRASYKNASHGFYKFLYLPMNGAIPKVVLGDVATATFSRSDIPNVSISEMWRTGAKKSNATFIDVNICHHMEPMSKSHAMNLPHIFKANIANTRHAVPADLPQFVRHLLSICSCYY